MENSVDLSQNIQNRASVRPSNTTPEYLSVENKNANCNDKGIPIRFSIIYNSRDMGAT